jgi:hypothetical protein
MKLNILLAKTDHLGTNFKAAIKDFIQFFKDKQDAFKGERKTYEPMPGTVDSPSERSLKMVTTTVGEKLDWFKESNRDYLDSLFALEATNASGAAKAELVVNGTSFGVLSSLELLRLKSLLENNEMEQMYSNIPVRSDSSVWTPTVVEMYKSRLVFDGEITGGIKKSITKESYILPDPNLSAMKDSSSYKPQIGNKDTVMELGTYSYQKFTGEWSHRERAGLLRRKSVLLGAVIEALKTANEAEAIESAITGDILIDYLHAGTLPSASSGK